MTECSLGKVSQSFLDRFALYWVLPVGAVLALAFAPFGIWPLAILCPAMLLLVWHGVTPRRAARLGFLFSTGTFLAGTYWIYHSVHVIGAAPIWIAVLLLLGLTAIMASYTALLGWLYVRYCVTQDAVRWLLIFPALWTLIEWLRGWLLSGFPWLSLGYAFIDSPLAPVAPVVGVYGVSFLAALTVGMLVACWLGTRRVRFGVLWLVAGGALCVWSLQQQKWTRPVGSSLDVAIVQGAVPQSLKWSEAWQNKTLHLYRELTQPHLGAQLIVWPEAALPSVASQLTEYLNIMWGAARASGSDLLLGLLHYDSQTGGYYNGLLVLGEQAQWYDKRRLVPFGEFFPVPEFIRAWLRLNNLPYSDLTPGATQQPALAAAGQHIGATICYEDAYGAEQLAVLRTATVLVNVTNDAWFGDSTAAGQHLQISRMRALEAGRPLLRAANDGISAIIDAQGAVVATLPRFQAQVLRGHVQPQTGLTPYAQVGNWPIIGLCCLVLSGLLLSAYRKRIFAKSD